MTTSKTATPQVPALPGMTPLGIDPMSERYIRATTTTAVEELIAGDATLQNANPENLRQTVERAVRTAYGAGAAAKPTLAPVRDVEPEDTAHRAAKASMAGDHVEAEKLFLMAAARGATFANQPTMKQKVKLWDKNASRERRLAELTKK